MPKQEEGDEWKAATKLAAVHKGRAARQHVKGQMEAATKLQAIQRGRLARQSGGGGVEKSTRGRAAAARAAIQVAAPAGGVYAHKALLKMGVKGAPLINPVPGLQFLTFFSWWNEMGTKRYMELCFDLESELFQVVLGATCATVSPAPAPRSPALRASLLASLGHCSN